MGFNKFARATIVKPDIHFDVWDGIRRASSDVFHGREAARVAIQEYEPQNFMLSHCTIIASVDTGDSGLPTGKAMVDGFQVDRRYPDWLITPDTDKYANNNNDAWERKLLLSCFRTFIGGENYVEHIQIPELSKGKIIDAAARDIGDSIYVDILIATERKHRPLITAIQKRQLQTLSMGCQVEFTICTKCGNVAYDETQLCPHVRYMKGNTYVDGLGRKRKIVELCGHIGAEPGSVKFIEASWVANPAFTGAVLRNILSAEEAEVLGDRIQVAFSQPPRTADPGSILKAARLWISSFGEQDTDVPPEAGGQAPPEEDPLDKAVNDLTNVLREKVVQKVRQDINRDEAKNLPLDENTNDTIIKSALKHPAWREMARSVLASVRDPKKARRVLLGLILFKHDGWRAVVASRALSGRDLLAVSRFVDLATRKTAMAGERRIYRAVLTAGSMNQYPNTQTYLAACRQAMGRELTDSEQVSILDKGWLFSLGS
jgi:hypothetical protein